MKKNSMVKAMLAILIVSFLIVGCGKTSNTKERELTDKPFERTEFLMGTVVKVTIYNKDKKAALDAAFNRIEELAGLITVDGVNEGSEV